MKPGGKKLSATSKCHSKKPVQKLPFFPKKTAAAINNFKPCSEHAKIPKELAETLRKTLKRSGLDNVNDDSKVFAKLGKRFPEKFKGVSLVESLANAEQILSTALRENPTFSSTIPIVWKDQAKKPQQIASGVLLRIENATFLLTAAHVFDNQADELLFIPGKAGFMPASGLYSFSRLPFSCNRADDNLDIGYILLDDCCTENLHSNCSILERKDVSLEATPSHRTTYTFAGYPWRKSKTSESSIETSFVTFSGIEAQNVDYEQLGLSRANHIAIKHNRRRSYSTKLKRMLAAPLPSGMSGGGVYIWNDDAIQTWPVRLPLVGIANEFIPEKNILIATRLHVYVQYILSQHSSFPD